MAKKITEEQINPAGDTTVNPTVENIQPATENTGGAATEKTNAGTETPEETAPETNTSALPQPKPAKETPAATNCPPFVETLLKTFPAYESLYIDSHGGAYAPNTSAAVRGNAVLYKNPFFKS